MSHYVNMDKLFGTQQEEKGLLDDINESMTLSKKNRMYGFCICFCLGMCLTFLSTLSIMHPTRFAIPYTLGNIISICSTAFLIGPWRQVKQMFKKKRVIATTIYLLSLFLTLYVALKYKSVPGVIVLLVIQFCALIWYVASYIPFAQAAIKNCLLACCGGSS